jgi:hypothetical protein
MSADFPFDIDAVVANNSIEFAKKGLSQQHTNLCTRFY